MVVSIFMSFDGVDAYRNRHIKQNGVDHDQDHHAGIVTI